MGSGRPEQRHDRIADELLHGAAEALELGPQADVVRRKPRADVLRVHLLGLRGRADDVGEEDGDELPFLGRRLRSKRRAAREAEFRDVRVVLSAARANGHAASVPPPPGLRKAAAAG